MTSLVIKLHCNIRSRGRTSVRFYITHKWAELRCNLFHACGRTVTPDDTHM